MLQFFVCLLCCLWQCNSQVRPILCIIDVPPLLPISGRHSAGDTLYIFFFLFVVCFFVCILALDLCFVLFWTRDHALHLLADIVVLQAVVNAGAVPHFVKLLRSPDHNVCEQVKSMISSPKIL